MKRKWTPTRFRVETRTDHKIYSVVTLDYKQLAVYLRLTTGKRPPTPIAMYEIKGVKKFKVKPALLGQAILNGGTPTTQVWLHVTKVPPETDLSWIENLKL
jgi:hypothetical protein